MSVWLELVEERVEAAKREAEDSADRALDRQEVDELEEEDAVSLRRRIASAMFFLGSKIDPEAALVATNKGEAA